MAVTVIVPGALGTGGAGAEECDWIVCACSTTRRAWMSSLAICREVSRRWEASDAR